MVSVFRPPDQRRDCEHFLGLAWLQESQPQPPDFVRLKDVPFAHALCGHGAPLRDTARQEFHAAFQRFFQV